MHVTVRMQLSPGVEVLSIATESEGVNVDHLLKSQAFLCPWTFRLVLRPFVVLPSLLNIQSIRAHLHPTGVSTASLNRLHGSGGQHRRQQNLATT